MTGFQFPWERFTVAAKLGYPSRLVTYNPGVAKTFLYTTHQDYWSGELVNLKTPATARYLDNGLQWFGWTCLEDRAWVHYRLNTEVPKPLYSDEEVKAILLAAGKFLGTGYVTFPVAAHSQPRISKVWNPMHRMAVSGPSFHKWPSIVV